MGRISIAPSTGFIASTAYTTNKSKPNFEALVLFDNVLTHHTRNNADPNCPWYRMHEISKNASAPGCLIQSSFRNGVWSAFNYEALVAEENVLWHYWFDHTGGWHRGSEVIRGSVGPPALFQGLHAFSQHADALHAFTRVGNSVYHIMRLDVVFWQPPGAISTRATGSPTAFKSTFGRGNYELFVPEGNELVHYWYENTGVEDKGFSQWHRGEVVTSRCTGPASAFQTSPKIHGGHFHQGNFELVVPEGDGVLGFYWKDNFNGQHSWQRMGELRGGFTGPACMMESFYGKIPAVRDGNFELFVPVGDDIAFYWREQGGWWNGPFGSI